MRWSSQDHRSGVGCAMFRGLKNEVGSKLRFAGNLHEQMEFAMNLSRSFRAMLRVLAFAGALSVVVVTANGAFARGGGGGGGGGGHASSNSGSGSSGSTASSGNSSGGRSQSSAGSGRVINTIHPIIAGRGHHYDGGRQHAGRHEGGRHHARSQSRGRHFAHRGHHMRHRTASLR
jgi:hypothetical protein